MSAAFSAILLAGIGTYALRASFLSAARRLVDLPPMTERILRQIPPAVLAALVLPTLVRPDATLDLWQPRLLAGVVAGFVSWRTRNIALTLVVGMTVLVALERVT